MGKITDEQKKEAKKQFNEYSKNASEENIVEIANKLDDMNRGPIQKIWDDVMRLWEMIKDKDAAWTAKAIAIGALLYLIAPIDAIPDAIPVLGLADDVGVVTLAIASLGNALSKYVNDEEDEA